MLEADRIFLKDFQNFTFKNRMMAVEALLQGGGKAKQYAALYLKHEDPKLDDAGAIALEQRTNEGARFQKVMFAKILGEFVAAVEDFGALCSAIRHRGAEGILARYLGSGVGEVGTFFDHVLQHSGENLGELFRLPDLAAIQAKLPADKFRIVSDHYANAPTHIAQVAKVYRDPPSGTLIQDLSLLPADWNARAYVMLDAPGTPAVPTPKGAIPQVFNKLKHRFMVIESVDEYSKLPNSAEFKAVTIEMTGPRVQALVTSLRSASMGIAEMVAILRILDEAGVAI